MGQATLLSALVLFGVTFVFCSMWAGLWTMFNQLGVVWGSPLKERDDHDLSWGDTKMGRANDCNKHQQKLQGQELGRSFMVVEKMIS